MTSRRIWVQLRFSYCSGCFCQLVDSFPTFHLRFATVIRCASISLSLVLPGPPPFVLVVPVPESCRILLIASWHQRAEKTSFQLYTRLETIVSVLLPGLQTRKNPKTWTSCHKLHSAMLFIGPINQLSKKGIGLIDAYTRVLMNVKRKKLSCFKRLIGDPSVGETDRQKCDQPVGQSVGRSHTAMEN